MIRLPIFPEINCDKGLYDGHAQAGYFMTDSSTYFTEKKRAHSACVLFRGDLVLNNTYHALCQPEGATPAQEYASKFIDFVASEEGQTVIRNYGVDLYGEAMYSDAAYAKQYDH